MNMFKMKARNIYKDYIISMLSTFQLGLIMSVLKSLVNPYIPRLSLRTKRPIIILEKPSKKTLHA